jgi:hypothetical protein
MKLIFKSFPNPGHEGIPGHQGGSLPRGESSNKKTFRHGTSIESADKIRTEGIRRNSASIGDRASSVYFMQDKSAIRDYVTDKYNESDEGFAIVEFDVPEEFTDSILEDEEEGDSFRMEKDVPTEWIRNIEYYDAKGKFSKRIDITKV